MGVDAQNFEQKTYRDYVRANGWPEGAVRAYINRVYKGAKLSDVCKPEHVQELNERYSDKKAAQKVVQKPAQKSNVVWPTELIEGAKIPISEDSVLNSANNYNAPADKKEKFDFVWRRQYLLDAINGGEMLMVVIGSFTMFGVFGLVPGLICVLFYVHSALEMRKGENEFAQDMGLFVCFVLSLVFTWLHGQTFWKLFDGAQELRQPVSVACSWIVSIISFFALWQTRNVRKK